MQKQKKLAILFISFFVVFICLPSMALAEKSTIKGTTFPGTCAATMEFVPKGDAYSDKSEPDKKSYATSQWYKDAVSPWKNANLTAIKIGPVAKDILGESIYVNKKAAAAFGAFSQALYKCSEIQNNTYKLVIYDHFACRLMTGETKLSYHAEGFAIDINVTNNKYFTGVCEPTKCDYPPCVLKAAKDSGISWGGGLPSSPLYPGICDGHHFEYKGGVSNIKEEDLIFCQKNPNPDACTSDKDCPKDKPLCSLAEFKCTAGKACTTSLDCAQTEFCDNSISQCLPQLPSGKPCDGGDQCISSDCVNKQCACKINGDCEKNQFCDTTKKNCAEKVAAGETCPTDPKNCISGVCEDKTIPPDKIPLKICVCKLNLNDQCPAGKYCSGGTGPTAGFCIDKLGKDAPCLDGSNAACLSGKCEVPPSAVDGKCTEPPPSVDPNSSATAGTTTPAAPTKYTTVPPKMSVPIPGLGEFQTEEITAGQTVSIPWLAQYIVAVYKYAITIGAIIAVIVFMFGGLQYLIGGAYAEAAGNAKKMMLGAVSGLVVLLASNLILQMINPKLTKLSSLTLESVPPLTLQESVDAVYGGTPADVPAIPSGSPAPPGQPGKWRSQMLDPSICGAVDNLNLPMPQRYEKLKQILLVWKKVGVDDGGAIYLRGGRADCSSFTSNEPEWLGFVLYKAVLNGKSNVFSPALANSACGKFLTTDLTQWLTKANGKNDYYKVKDLKANHPDFVNAISGCLNPFRNEYKTMVQVPARQNGLLCGDCGTTLVSLYHYCFDKKISSDQVKDGNNAGAIVRFTVETATIKNNPAPYVSKLKLGDIIRLKGIGHYVMYTGGAGLPFEIIEMGGGGSKDTAMSSGKLANTHAGTSVLDVSAMRAHTNAIGFFKGTPTGGSVIAWGVLDNPKLQ